MLAPERLLEPVPVVGTVGEFGRVRLQAEIELSTSRIRNGLIARCHYMGYTPFPGAQLRYLSPPRGCGVGGHGLWGGRLEGGGARSLDRLGGPCRAAHLGRVLNSARFLLLPWVQVKHLASMELALAAARIPEDLAARYDEQVVLLETFVERPRFAGT